MWLLLLVASHSLPMRLKLGAQVYTLMSGSTSDQNRKTTATNQGGKHTDIGVSKRVHYIWHEDRLDSQISTSEIMVTVLQRLEIDGRPSWTAAPPRRCAPPAPLPRSEMRRRPPVSPGIQRSAVRRPLTQVRAWNRAAPFLGLARPGQDPMPPTGPRGSSLGASRIPTLTAHIARRLGCGGSLSGAAGRETCVGGNWAGAQMRAGGGPRLLGRRPGWSRPSTA